MPMHLRHEIASIFKRLGKLCALRREKRYHLLSEGQTLLDHNPEIRTGGKPNSVGERIYRMIHVEQDLGYDADVNDGFKEPKDCCKQPTALNNSRRANCVQCDISDSRHDNQDKGNGYRSRHVACLPPTIFYLYVRLILRRNCVFPNGSGLALVLFVQNPEDPGKQISPDFVAI